MEDLPTKAVKSKKGLVGLGVEFVTTGVESSAPCLAVSKDFQPLRVWIVCDALNDNAAFEQLASAHGFTCERVVPSNGIIHNISNVLTDHLQDPPHLVWIALPKRLFPAVSDKKHDVAVRLLLHQQLQSGNKIVVEGATKDSFGSGFYVPEDWSQQFPLVTSKVWWCKLGFSGLSQKQCCSEFTVSNFELPSRYLSCCGRAGSKAKKGIKPKSTPAGQYISVVKMLREAFSVSSPSATNSENEVANNFPSNSVVKRKLKAQGAKTLTENDGPGDHEDSEPFVIKASAVIEDHFDDCGDDLTSIMDAADKLYLASSCFCSEEADSTHCPSEDENFDESEGLDELFDSAFMSWAFPGSEVSEESTQLSERPCSTVFANCSEMLVYLDQNPGQHDICELFGGKALCTQIAIRRKLRTGPNFDVTCEIDLTDQSQVQALWKYVKQHKPRCIIAGPPCTAFGTWARLNSKLSPENHQRQLAIGTLLAKLVAELCMHQLKHHLHFLVETPWGSALWQLSCFMELLAQTGVAFAQCDQCMLGLCDPDGVLTLKSTCFLGSCETIIKRLRIRCDASHVHVQLAGKCRGVARCRFAQAWPRRLCELIIDGICDALSLSSKSSVYPAARSTASVTTDRYGGSLICKGCNAHAAKHDPRHTRAVGICRFPDDLDVVWGCPACVRFRPSNSPDHLLDESCQWTVAQTRASSSRVLPRLKDPKVQARVAPTMDADEALVPPPPVAGFPWRPLSDRTQIATLGLVQQREGWHSLSGNESAQCWSNGRTIKSSEPRYPASTFQCRSVFGYFPENAHSAGVWWQLEDKCKITDYPIGYSVPTLVLVFHRLKDPESVPKEKEFRSGTTSVGTDPSKRFLEPKSKASPSVPPVPVPTTPAAPAEPATLEEEDPPPGEPIVAPDVVIEPDWTSFDMGRCLRALRSDKPAVYARALQRLHLRLWHCSATRMLSLLRAVGVAKVVLDLIPSICSTCKVCRAWQKPGHRAVTSSRLSDEFNHTLQFDLFFFEEHVIAVLLCEATRWCCADVIASKDSEQILRFISDRWLRIYGSPKLIVSDQEGGLFSEESSIFAERMGFALRPKPIGSHAAMVERHHQVLRDTLHKVVMQARCEKLFFSFSDCLSQVVFAKNALTNVGGHSPYVAVFGRHPQLLTDLESAGQSAVRDGEGGIAGASRHAIRMREIALEAMISATASSRLRIAEKSNTRASGQLTELLAGDMVDVYRAPSRKDLTGWRGPAEVLSTRRIDEGVLDIKWGGRTIIARTQDVRRHILFVFLLETAEAPFLCLQRFLLQMLQGSLMLSWVSTPSGWILCNEAKTHQQEFHAVLYVAATQLHIPRCIGARVGRGFAVLSGLHDIAEARIVWWPAALPSLYQICAHHGKESVNLRTLFKHDEYVDFCWIQFLSVDVPKARRIRHLSPAPSLAAQDPQDPYMPDHPMPPRPPAPKVNVFRPPPPKHSPNVSPVQSEMMPQRPPSSVPSERMSQAVPSKSSTRSAIPFAPWKAAGGHAVPHGFPKHVSPASTASNSTVHQPQPKMPPPSPVPTRSSQASLGSKATLLHEEPSHGTRRPLPSNSSSSHRPEKRTNFQEGGSSSSGHNPVGPLPAPAHVPLLPVHDDDDISTLNADSEDFDDIDFYVSLGEGPVHVFLSADKIIVEKSLGELTPHEIKQHWEEVSKGVTKELRSFTDLGVFKVSPKGTTGNCMTSRWVMRWKKNAETLVEEIKARLTVRGFLDSAGPDLLTYAGTASRWGQRLVVAVACQKRWPLVCADVGSAFLKSLTFKEIAEINNEPIRRCAFLPPTGYSEFIRSLPNCGHFDERVHELELLKPIYGLKDAPRAWRRRLHDALTVLKATNLKTDRCIYLWRSEESGGRLLCICSAHVDDLKLAGETNFVKYLLHELEKLFGKLKVVHGSFEHCGIQHEYSESDGSYRLHQNHFVERLKTPNMEGIPKQLPKQSLTEPQIAVFLSGLGSLAWLVQTRMDVAVYIQALQRNAKKPTVAHMMRLCCVIRWCKRKPVFIRYCFLETDWFKVLVCNDAAFRREDSTGLAMRGSIIAWSEDRGTDPSCLCNIIDFFSRKQRRVVRSTFGAETNAAADGLEVGRLVCYTLAEIVIPNCTAQGLVNMDESGALPFCMQLVTDCKSLFDNLRCDDTAIPTEQSLIMILLQIKEGMRTGTIRSIVWADTRDLIADGLTKGSIARADLLQFSMTSLWKLKHTFELFTEPHKVPIISSAAQALIDV